ncbi:MAG: hypothetical protein MRY74_14010 [Neomegalonema sp.]|nr:hypothetical protein [Neomegalonema sp.]
MAKIRVRLNRFRRFISDPSLNQERSVVYKDGVLHVIVQKGLKPADLRRDGNRALGAFSLGAIAIFILGVVGALAFGAVAVLFVGMVSHFGNLLGAAISSQSLPSNPIELAVFFAVPVVGAFVFSFLPSLAASNGNGIGRRILRRLSDDGDRDLRRAARRLSASLSNGSVSEIHVWNPYGFDQAHCARFFQLLFGMRSSLRTGEFAVYLHHDELADWSQFATSAGVEWESDAEEAKGDSGDWREAWAVGAAAAPKAGGDDAQELSLQQVVSGVRRLNGEAAASLAGVLFLSSTKTAVEPWAEALSTSPAYADGLVSLHFAAIAAQRAFAAEGDFAAPEVEGLRDLYERATKDYRLLRPTSSPDAATISPRIKWRLEDAPEAWERLRPLVAGKAAVFAQDLPDASAALAALVRLGPTEMFASTYRQLVERLIECAWREEDYVAVAVLGDAIAPWAAIDRGKGLEAAQAGVRQMLSGVSLDRLRELGGLLQAAGQFNAAFGLCEWLESVDPLDQHLEAARLLERHGRFEEGLQRLLSRFREEAGRVIEMGPDQAMELDDKTRLFAVRYYLLWSWILFSGALTGPGRGAQAAKELLSAVRPFIEHPRSAYLTPMDRWRFWCYLGLTVEWSGDYNGAAALHARAADLPGVQLRWVGGSFINAGVAARRGALAMASVMEDDAESRRKVTTGLRQAQSAVMRGVEMKLGLGDLDEGAIGLHNAAYINLCLARADDEATVESAREAAELSRIGLNILSRTKSQKKMALLAAENAFAHMLLLQVGAATADGARHIVACAEHLAMVESAAALSEADLEDIFTLEEILFERRSSSISALISRLRGDKEAEHAA